MNRQLNLFILLLFILAGSVCYGQFKYNPQALVPFDPAYKIGKLDNGIRYMIRSNPADKGKAYFYAFFKIGSMQEKPDEYGAAHFVEHLYADCFDSEIWIKKYLQSLGLKMGPDINAATSPEKTQYTLFNVQSQRKQTLDSALMILKIIPFHSISPTEVDKQRKIILAELREKSGTDCSNKTLLHETLGDTAVLNHITANQLKQFHDKWYRPDNLIVIAIGDFDASNMEARIKQIFSSIPKAEGKNPLTSYQLSDNKEPVVEIARAGKKENIVEISYRHNALPYTTKRLRAELIDQLISEMFSQRIREVSENQPFSLILDEASYSNSYLMLFACDSYRISFQSSGDNINKGLNLVLTEKERVDQYGFTSQELMQVKKRMLHNYQIQQQKGSPLPYSEYFIKCMYYILNGEIFPSSNYFCQFVSKVIPNITLKEINERFKTYTAGIQPMVNIMVAQDGAMPTPKEIKAIITSSHAQELSPYVASRPIMDIEDKTIHPGHIVKETLNVKLGTTEWILSNGMRIVIKTTSFNTNKIAFNGFCNKDLTLNLKDEYSYLKYYGKELYNEMGFGKYSNVKLSQFLSTKHLSVQKDFQSFIGYTVPKDFKTCLQLIRLKYTNQQWNEVAYQNRLQQLQKETCNSDYEILGYLTANAMDSNEPTAPILPKAISMEQFRQLHQKIFGNPSDFTFIFSGNISPKNIKPLVERYLASIPYDSLQNNIIPRQLYDNKIHRTNHGRICNEFKYQMRKQEVLIDITCYGYIDKTLWQKPYLELSRDLLSSYLRDILREKNQAIYSLFNNILVDSRYDNDILHFTGLGIYFSTRVETSNEINNIAQKAFTQFMLDGPEEKDFEFQKALLIKEHWQELKSNEWWTNRALYEYYSKGIDIVPTYLSDTQNMTKEDLIKFTHTFYNQDNLINTVMSPK